MTKAVLKRISRLMLRQKKKKMMMMMIWLWAA